MSEIILVGNGPSILENELGSEIDSFDKVVRFNNFEIEGYEKHVGSKCDILARRACDDVRLWPTEMFEEVVCFVTYCQWTQGMLNVARQIKGHYEGKCTVVFPHTCASNGKVEHYFPKPPKDDKFHNGDKERIFTDSLISQDKVVRLI